ncbi:pilus assembly protein PilB, partial [Nitrospiraceae bacterium AH_259_D15_M11_P09]|nr:pilus assembly protein PilB [Nitrospiraceae bacterium AH_259_D15_M11_P09]
MPSPIKRTPLEDILVNRGLLSREQLDSLLGQANGTSGMVRTLLVEQGLITEESLAEALAEQYGLAYDPLKDFRIDPEFFKTIPLELMHRYPFVPIHEQDGELTIAVVDPQNLRALDELELQIGREFRMVVSTSAAILEALKQSEGNIHTITRIQAEFRPVLIREDE